MVIRASELLPVASTVKETTDVCLLASDAAQGTDLFDLVTEAIWFDCIELFDLEQFSCPAK